MGSGNLLVLGVGALLMGSCAHFVTKNKSYLEGGEVEINGAMVRSAVKPNGGEGGMSLSAMVYSAGTATLDGPFKWRIEATGEEGQHKGMTVHRLKVTTRTTKRNEWYPVKYLGKLALFESLQGEAGKVFAQYPIPGELEVFPEVDGAIEILADISVRTVERVERRVVRFSMAPSESREVEAIFLPAEIVRGFGEKDPREWAWKTGRGGN